MGFTLDPEHVNLCKGSIVRTNLMTEPNYSPYCGRGDCPRGLPRTTFINNLNQFKCSCGWTSGFPKEFIDAYKQKWSKE